jgi:hypothetical protein
LAAVAGRLPQRLHYPGGRLFDGLLPGKHCHAD